MARVRASGTVKEHLRPGEELLGKAATQRGMDAMVLYATDQRIHVESKSLWWTFLFGWLVYLLVRSSYKGAIEYAKISKLSLTSGRNTLSLWLGGFIAIVLEPFGIWILILGATDPDGGFGVLMGLIFIILGFIPLIVALVVKVNYCHLKIQGRSKTTNFRFMIPKWGPGRRQIEAFVEIIKGKVSRVES